MIYTINSHDDENKTFLVIYNKRPIVINYPKDIEIFTDIPDEDFDVIISGMITPYENMPDYIEEVVEEQSLENTGDWF